MSKKNIVINCIISIMLCCLICATLTINTSSVFSNTNNDIIYEGNRNSNNVSLMFNVYSGTEYLINIVKILDSYGLKATFFIGGIWAEKNINLVKHIINNGHEIGNHGYLHLDHNSMDYKQNYDEIYACHNLLKEHLDYEMSLFAPPSGAFNNATLTSAKDLGYLTIMWSKDTIDWRDQDSNLIFARATKNVKGGDLILMHPTKKTVESLIAILEYYKINNLIVSTVSRNLQLTE